MKVLITEKLSEHRYRTPEGYLVCVDAILARTGKQLYKHNQVYDGSTDEITDIEVDRKPEQVFSPQAIASFENKPLTIQHPNEPVTIANHKDLYHGFARDIRRAVKRNGQILTGSKRPTQLQDGDQELLVGNIIVTTAEAIEEIDNGLEFLSCGYDCDITQTDTPEQINIRGNHIALCDNPRAGITMLQDNVELAELPVKHIVKVLTDAVIEQANKVRMNDALSETWKNAGPQVENLFKQYVDKRVGNTIIDRVFRNISVPYSDELHFGISSSINFAQKDITNLINSHKNDIERIYSKKLVEVKMLRSSPAGTNQVASITFRLKFDGNIWNDSISIIGHDEHGAQFIKVLTDAVIEQKNKVRMNDEGSIVNRRIWNPDFYLKKEPRYEETRNTIQTVLKNSGLTVEEVTLSVYGSVIRFNKNMKLDANQMKSFINQLLAKINQSLKAEKFRSMAGKFTFEITGYEYLQKYLKDALNYVVMCEVLYNGVAVKSRAPWIVFRTEDKAKAEQFVKENNAKTKSLVGFSQHYYIK